MHDVSAFLVEHSGRLPAALMPHLDRLVSVSRRLRREREVSFYGDEESGAAPDRLYTGGDAEQAVGDARLVVELCERHPAVSIGYATTVNVHLCVHRRSSVRVEGAT